MQAHIVLAHPETKSYNANLARVAGHALEEKGWGVTFSDLYVMGFDPCERAAHYPDRKNVERFDVQAEQRFASEQGTIPNQAREEITRLDQADLLILQYPMWWHLPPAILKGWFDRVFVYGDVYTSKQRFEHGRFVGKRALLSVTVGTSAETYAYNGRSGDIGLLLWPVNFTLAYVGFEILSPFIAYGVEAGLRYSNPAVLNTRLKQIRDDLAIRLRTIEDESTLPFNRMSEWGDDGRIKPTAAAYSPFIRHREHLKLE